MRSLKKEIQRNSYTVREMANILGIELNDAYNLTLTEGFPIVRDGRRAFIPKDAFHEWHEKFKRDYVKKV